MEPWSVTTLAICFGGGVLGAGIGGLFSFVICGIVVLIGCLVVLNGGSDFILMQIGLGPIFGPHAGGFLAGIVAGTYAAGVRKNHPGGSAKDILSPLMDTSWDVLTVGGVGALFGHCVLQLFVKIPVISMFDCIALTVVLVQLATRLIFLGEMPWGNIESIRKFGLLGTDNYTISWAPWNAQTEKLIVLGLAVGLFSGGLAMMAKAAVDPIAAKGIVSATDAFVVPLILGWSIAAISLVGLQLGTGTVQKFPIWHAQAILAALAYLYFGSIIVCGFIGILASFLQEFMARLFYNHGSNHIDPPACAITVGTFMLNVAYKAIV